MIALDTNILIYACDKADSTGVISQNGVSGPRPHEAHPSNRIRKVSLRLLVPQRRVTIDGVPSGKACPHTRRRFDMPPHDASSCPVPSTHDKYNEARYFFAKLLEHYHRPEEFQFNLNAFIQAIRNITFMLQSEENKPEGFDEWYAKKQAAMRADAALRRFVEARNIIVKRSSPSAMSAARSGLFRGRKLKLAVAHELPPFMDTLEALENAKAFAYALFLDEEHSAIGEQAGVERVWVVTELGGDEAALTCLRALNYMGELVAEAHRLCGGSDRHEPITVDMRQVQVLLETDVDPTLLEKWGW